MAKLLRQNVGGTDYTMAGCTLTGVCASAAADFIKAVTLSDGDTASDGMTIACTFANGNSAGTAPDTLTIYSSDQVNYYSDSELTQPFTLAPSGCYTIEYTGTGNAYTYQSYPIIVVGNVSGPLCDTRGKPAGGAVWDAGDAVLMLYSGNKFMAISGLTNVVTAGSKKAVTSNAVFNYVNRLDIKVPRPTLQYSKVTVALNVSEAYITTLVALMTRGCGLCLIGLCGQDSGTMPNIVKYLSNNGYYSSNFYYRDIGDKNKIELYWTGSAYSTRDSIAILTNTQNAKIEEVSYVSTLPSDVVAL